MTDRFVVNNQSKALRNSLEIINCKSFLCKARGLSWKFRLPADEGLLLVGKKESKSGTGIHMLGMFFPLTVVWLNEKYQVVDVQKAYPWRSFIVPEQAAKYVIECGLSRFDEFAIGDQISLEAL